MTARRPYSRPAFLSALAVALALAAPAARAASEHAVFDLSVSGIRIGQVSLTTETTAGGYRAASRIETAGLVGLVADYFFDGTATGRLRGKAAVPELYEARSRSPRADRATTVTWKDGTPVSVSVMPPRASAPDPAQQAGTFDPITAGFRLLGRQPAGAVCGTSLDVFDGSRRSRLVLGKPVASGREIRCYGTFARLEGEAHTLSSAREAPFRLVFARAGDDMAEIQRIETTTRFGTAVLQRRD